MHLYQALRLAETPHKPIIALTGAGGKSSLLFRLGRELKAAGLPALLTATTHLGAQQVDQAPFALFSRNEALLHFELPVSLQAYGQALVMAATPDAKGKLPGLSPELVCRLAALADVGAVVAEADGSRQRPLKAPAAHEPVVPCCITHLVVVMGMAALGHPLTEQIAHRPELVAQCSGLAMGETITPQAAARLLLHPAGGLQGAPPDAQRFAYLNIAGNDPARLAAAREIATRVLQAPTRPYAAVLIGSAQAEQAVMEVHSYTTAIVLAAGRGSRFGIETLPKQILPWPTGGTLVGHVADLALAIRSTQQVITVTGYAAAAVQEALAGRALQCVHNLDWADGQSSSVAAGLAALAPHTSAALFLLADQPAVDPAVAEALIKRHRETQAPIVAPVYTQGGRGNPVLFDRSLFAELAALSGDTGGRVLLERLGAAVQFVEVPGVAPRGIENAADYAAAFEEARIDAKGWKPSG